MEEKQSNENSLGIQNNKSFMYAVILLVISLLWISALAYSLVSNFANNDKQLLKLKDSVLDKLEDYKIKNEVILDNILDNYKDQISKEDLEKLRDILEDKITDLEESIEDIEMPSPTIIISPPY